MSAPGTSGRWRFWRGLAAGFAISLTSGIAMLYWASASGLLLISVPRAPAVVDIWYWSYDNLRWSVVPFIAVLIWFFTTLQRLGAELGRSEPALQRVQKFDRQSDLQAVLFFGVGVIWTAIGLRSALLGALGDLDAAGAARLGAFHVLQRLVDEGILLALTTTIVGGIGGYLMRVTKSLRVGMRLDLFYESLRERDAREILERLEAIEAAVRRLGDRPGTVSTAAGRDHADA